MERDVREEWSRGQIMKLIEVYRQQDCLWNPNNICYRDKRKRHAAWRFISASLNKDLLTVERKIKVLKTQFMHSYNQVRKFSSNGETYRPKWFAYRSLLFLIPAKYTRENKDMSKMNMAEIEEIKAEPIEPPEEDYYDESAYDDIPTHEQMGISNPAIIEEPPLAPEVSLTPNKSQYRTAETQNSCDGRDEFTIFGELLACRLRQMKNTRTRLKLQFNISNLVFEAQMQEADEANNANNGVEGFRDDNVNNMG